MTRPKASALAFVGALAAVGVGTLLWSAWLVLTAPLPTGAATAAWVLWLLSVVALVTLVAYLRELVRHGVLERRGSWKPLPGLPLLWVAGLSAVVAFPFVLPERPSGPTQQQESAESDRTAPSVGRDGPTTGRDGATSVSRSSRTGSTPDATNATTTSASTSTSRSATSATLVPRGSATTPPTASATTSRTKGPKPSSSATLSPTSSTSTSTSTPIIDLTLPPAPGRPTDKPPRGR
ncbi:hypothetical protein GCM10009867_32430 [Pedococcus aerophilus]|uniref:Uncharacterized protein n=1 Tax=Pedococcus aerophilus TaxID=436356 RepID=A0ABN3UV50_9MICO